MNQLEKNITEIISNVNEMFSNYKLFIDEYNVVYLNKYSIGIDLFPQTDSDDITSKIVKLKNINGIRELYIELSEHNVIKIDDMTKKELPVGYFDSIGNLASFFMKRIYENNDEDSILELLCEEKILDSMKIIQYAIYYNCINPELIMDILNAYIDKLHEETNFCIKNNIFYLKNKCLDLQDLNFFKINIFNKNSKNYFCLK
ncbi:hypothetical protein [Pectobacterium carotovorum]|uniref:hypothetical protein n=1 Tax=Pectobacterium carotovorum TaxID=554 RepID=UPI00381B8A1A